MKFISPFIWLSQPVCSLGSSTVSCWWNLRLLCAPPVSEVATFTSSCSAWLNSCGTHTVSQTLDFTTVMHCIESLKSDLWHLGQYSEKQWTLIVQKYAQRIVFSTLMHFLMGFLSLGHVFKPGLNGRFLSECSVNHGPNFGSPGLGPTGMTCLEKYLSEEKRVGFMAYD